MISIKETTAYRTTDGTVFASQSQAVEYEVDRLLSTLCDQSEFAKPVALRQWLKKNAHELAPVLADYARHAPRVEEGRS